MGLDATWYTGLKKREDVVFDGDGEPTNVDNYFRPYVNSDFPGREEGVEHRAVYEYEDAGTAFSGGYGGYNSWREWLAKLAGYPLTEFKQYGQVEKAHAAACWKGAIGPFSELINFTDCEGVIGPVVAAKLAKDFAAFDSRAQAASEGNNYDRYKRWREAFEKAAQNGAVDFH
jgi:hypothetical protein